MTSYPRRQLSESNIVNSRRAGRSHPAALLIMDKKEEIHGRVLYVEPDNTDFVEEKWHFSVDALKVARQFIHRQEKPFSREVNGSFLRQFAKAKKGVVKNE